MNSPNQDQEIGCALVLFARSPQLGQVKTRLAATVGNARALEIYRDLVEHVVGHVRELSGVAAVIACTPDEGVSDMEQWFPGLSAEGQGEGDLGLRMQRAMDRAFARGAHRVVILGTDCPEADARVMQQAFSLLGQRDVVFGPATDGGYYLVGARRETPPVFSGIPWSASNTLAVSVAAAQARGLDVALLDPLSDIDTEYDWLAWRARVPNA